MERCELARKRATKELAKLLEIAGLGPEVAQMTARKWVQRAAHEASRTIRPLLNDAA